MQGDSKGPGRKSDIDFTSRKVGAMAGSQGGEALASSCCIHSETQTEGGKLNDLLLSQAQIIEREHRNNKLHELAEDEDSGKPKVAGFGSLSLLEAEQQRITAELEAKRTELATRQSRLESAILDRQILDEKLSTGDAMFQECKNLIEFGICEFVESRLGKSPESGAMVLRGLSEVPARREFIELWPSMRKGIQAKIKKADAEIKTMMEKGESK